MLAEAEAAEVARGQPGANKVAGVESEADEVGGGAARGKQSLRSRGRGRRGYGEGAGAKKVAGAEAEAAEVAGRGQGQTKSPAQRQRPTRLLGAARAKKVD